MAIRQVNPDEPAGVVSGSVSPDVTPSGYGPASLQSAYALPSSTAGSGQTVAIVDAYDDPNAESDLTTYRSQYGLPACTTANGCFRKVNQSGATSPLPAANTSWAGEISLDVDMVSAVCPNCHILLVEANSAYLSDLGTAVNTAVSLGAKFVSNSYGAGESGSENSYDSSYFHHPGVAITASTGDNDYDGGSYPATSAYVTAVGGTSLTTAANSRGWSETVWNTFSYTEGTGSGCSQDVAKPAFQSGISTGCSRRAEADVSAVADPATGVAVYQSYGGSGWMVYGGTSAASPIVASVYALAGTPGASDIPNAYPYAHTGNLNDVTSGSNGTCGAPLCTAGTGWDGPTGLGTPNGVAAFAAGGTDSSCGEASCTPVQAAYISHYTGAGCTGTESYYTPYFGYDGIRRSWDGHGMAGTILRTVTNRSYRTSDGVCHDAWPNGNTLSDFVTIYR
ncbi:MAG TPA: S53 family peptidase [Jatrophihabitans sp.]|nr:S53 family peptidase [Jatrophihabitans sp.]